MADRDNATPAEEQARADVEAWWDVHAYQADTDYWVAGLFEGEGCATTGRCGKKGYTSARAQVRMADEEPIRWFHEIVGVGSVTFYNPPSAQKSGRKPLWVWSATTRQARTVLRQLYPYLSPRRQRRIDALLAGDYRSAREQEAA